MKQKRKRNDKNLPRKDWITKGIIISCNHKDELLQLYEDNLGNESIKK